MADSGWTKEEVLEEAGAVRERIRQIFAEEGHLRAITFLYATRNPKTEEDGKGLVLMPALGRFEKDERQAFATMIRVVGRRCAAMGIIFASEVWTVDPKYQEEIGFERALEEAKNWKGSLEDHPRKIEGIWMTVEHHRLTGHHTWFAAITRDAEGKGTLGEWTEQHWDNPEMRGRFIDMLPPVN